MSPASIVDPPRLAAGSAARRRRLSFFCSPQAEHRLHTRPLRILGFFLLFLFVVVTLDQLFTLGLRRIKTSEFGASNAVFEGRVNADIVISGSSRALVHYDPRLIQSATGKSAYNLGRNAAQIDMQWAFLKAYLSHNRKPELVIHNLDPYTFVLSKQVYDPAQYIPYLSDTEIYSSLKQIDGNTWRWKYLPLYAYSVADMNLTWIKAVSGLLGRNPREDFFLGYNPRDLLWTSDFASYKAKHSAGVMLDIEPAGVKVLEDLIQTCKNRGINVILVFSPEYTEMQALTVNRAKIFRAFQSIADRCDVPFWDYSQMEMCKDQSYFYNSQHLNRHGATEFSKTIGTRLQSEHPWRTFGNEGNLQHLSLH